MVLAPIVANLRFGLGGGFSFYCHDTLPVPFGMAAIQVWPRFRATSLPSVPVNLMLSAREALCQVAVVAGPFWSITASPEPGGWIDSPEPSSSTRTMFTFIATTTSGASLPSSRSLLAAPPMLRK